MKCGRRHLKGAEVVLYFLWAYEETSYAHKNKVLRVTF